MNVRLFIIAVKGFAGDLYLFFCCGQPFEFNLNEYVLFGIVIACLYSLQLGHLL